MRAWCSKHPKYRGKRPPKRECVDCAMLYLQTYSIRIAVAPPTIPHKDKSKYSRKKKHKKAIDTDTI